MNARGSSNDTILVGNGISDMVSASGSQYDTITLGNGAGDTVNDVGQQLQHNHPRQRCR